MSGQPWQVLADCPRCRVEAAVVEWMDPAHASCAAGEPESRRCRACGHEERWLEVGRWDTITSARDLRVAGVARASLAAWCEADGGGDLDAFCLASFGLGADEVVARLGAGEAVGSTFDVIAFLFPHAGAASAPSERPRLHLGEAPEPRQPPPTPPLVTPMEPRTPGRFLVSVMVADGALRAGERAFVDRFLLRNELPALAADDLRVWRPLELGPPPPPELRDRLLEAAVHLMHLDRSRDGAEWRVVRAFASAWGVPESTVVAWDERYSRRYTTVMQRLGALLGGWVT